MASAWFLLADKSVVIYLSSKMGEMEGLWIVDTKREEINAAIKSLFPVL